LRKLAIGLAALLNLLEIFGNLMNKSDHAGIARNGVSIPGIRLARLSKSAW
jgi:hypothetical protein